MTTILNLFSALRHLKSFSKLAHFFPAAVITLLISQTYISANTAPNILYIYTDDQSTRTVSCYPDAYNYANTPNIDSLATEGIRFDQAYMGAKCVPARAGTLTGRLQYDTREDANGAKRQEKYWLTALRNNGYYTGMIGKWHWGESLQSHGHGVNWDWSVIWNHSLYKPAGDYYYNQYVVIDGGPTGNTDPVAAQELLGGDPNTYSTDAYTDYTKQFIQERANATDGKPWFFWLCYAGVHGPYTPADRHIGIYDNAPTTRTPADVFPPRLGKPTHVQETRWSDGGNGVPYRKGLPLDFWAKQYTEAVASIDEGVGEIIQTLKDTGQYDNTIIVFTSDQGYAWGQHGLKNKLHPYAAAIKSPLIVSYPGVFPAGTVCDAAVNGPDVIRTFHDLTNTTPDQDLHGRDMALLLANPESESVVADWSETPTLMTYTYNRYDAQEIADAIIDEEWSRVSYDDRDPNNPDNPIPEAKPIWFMSTDGKYKYIRYCFPDRMEELYDVKDDPEELVNLATQPEYAVRLLNMRSALVEELKLKGGAPFADILPTPKSAAWWPILYATDNAYVLHDSNQIQRDNGQMKTKREWGKRNSRLAYLRFNLSGANEINGYPADDIASASLNLWMTQTEGDRTSDLEVYALVDGAVASGLSESSWNGGNLTGLNLPQGDIDPVNSTLTTAKLGSYGLSAIGDNNELGLLQIPLSANLFKNLINADSNGEITLIVRSTATGNTVNFASINNTSVLQTAPALSITPLPSAPVGLTATSQSNSIALSWNSNDTPNFAGYTIYRSSINDPTNYTLIATDLLANAYTDDSVLNGVQYYYVVTAFDSAGNESNFSNEVSATPIGDVTPPAVPANLTIIAGDDSIWLEWDSNSESDLQGYNIYRGTSSGNFVGTPLASVDLSSDAYQDATVSNGTEYFYAITAVDSSNNQSTQSAEVSATAYDSFDFGTGAGKLDLLTTGFTTNLPDDGLASDNYNADAYQIVSGPNTKHGNYTFLKTFNGLADGSNKGFTITMEASLADKGTVDKNLYRYGIALFNDSQNPDTKGINALLIYDNGTLVMELREGLSGATLASTNFKVIDGGELNYPEDQPYLFNVTGTYTGNTLELVFTLSNGSIAQSISATVDSTSATYNGTLFGGAARIRNSFAVDFDYIKVGPSIVTDYQAESYSATQSVSFATDNAGFTGTGFMDYGGNGSWMEWNNVTGSRGIATLELRYANGAFAARECEVFVNGTSQGTIAFSSTGSWTNWGTKLTTVVLSPGTNTIRIQAITKKGGPNLDLMNVIE